jgi:O-antigen/teichoic acid export membrane protein
MKAFGLVFLGLMASQAIVAILPLALAKVLSPEEMGIIAGLTAVVGIFGGVAHLRFANIINIADSEADAVALEKGSIKISILISAAIFLIMALVDLSGLVPQLTQWRPWSYFIPAWVLTTSLYTSKTEFFVFKKNYQHYSLINVIRSLVTVSLHLPMIWIGGIFIPLLAKTLGELVPFIFLRQKSQVTSAPVADVLKKYRHYSIHDTPIYIMTLLSKNIIFFSIGAFYSLATLGIFSLSYKIFKIPLSLVGESLRKVIERKLKDQVNNQLRFSSILYRAVAGITIVVAILNVGIYFFINPLFDILFDERWSSAGNYVIALLPAMTMGLLTTPYQSAYKVQGKMKILTRVQIFQSILVVIAIFCSQDKSAITMVWAYSFAWAIAFSYLPAHDLFANGLGLRKNN